MEKRPDVILAVMKLSRAMRRGGPHPHGMHGFHMMGGIKVLELLAEEPGLSSGELSERLDMRPSSVTETVDRLVREELAVRVADEKDKRVTRVELTDKGRERAAEHAAKHAGVSAKLTACFTDEEAQQFVELCSRLTDHINSLNEEGDFGGEHHRHHHHHHCGPGFPGFPPPPPPPEDEDEGDW